MALDTDAVAAVIAGQAVAGGGYGLPNSSQASATQRFLAALSLEMLGDTGADVEYTHYGVGCLALVRLGIGNRERQRHDNDR